MGKKQSGRKRGRESAKYEATKAPRGMARTVGFECPRCGTDIGSPANVPDHNATAHLPAGR